MRLPPPEADSEGPNLTPVIDVVFLLLIFFLVATRFDQEERLVSLRLAEIFEARPMVMGPDELIVNVSKEGKYVVVDQTLSEKRLIDLLHDLKTKNPDSQSVQIRADREVRFKYPLTVIGICKEEKLPYSCTVLKKRRK
ncbi:MAG: biopolymer transporter ExbD [Planctomycetes bacterium]|nr:biopolymer transporter ExbD [Planctomycetota bacterium]